jgi:hypothetical protein
MPGPVVGGGCPGGAALRRWGKMRRRRLPIRGVAEDRAEGLGPRRPGWSGGGATGAASPGATAPGDGYGRIVLGLQHLFRSLSPSLGLRRAALIIYTLTGSRAL